MHSFGVLTPWFSPRLTPHATRVVQALGHPIRAHRGAVLGAEDSRVTRLLFVQRGLVARTLVNPRRSQPLAWQLAGAGSLCGGCQNMYSGEHWPRRHVALRDSEVLEVPHELMLKIADRDVALHREMAAYCERSAMSDKLGMLVTQLSSNAERVRHFMAAALIHSGVRLAPSTEEAPSWLRLPPLPRRAEVAQAIGCSHDVLDRILLGMIESGDLERRPGALFVTRRLVEPSWEWLRVTLGAESRG